MKTLKLAVVGKDVSASTSPQIHKFISGNLGREVDYIRLSIPESEIASRAESLFEQFDGFNVTIPYKLSIIPYLASAEGDAKIFGSVNTVDSRTRRGYNTDGLGFALMLRNSGVDCGGKRALVLGAGGAGRSVAKKLADGGAVVEIYDRFAKSADAVAGEFGVRAVDRVTAEKRYLIVNATGVGMHGTVGQSPVGEDILSLCEVAADLIYTPPVSAFLEIASSLGKKVINGEAMLFYQAYYSECIYFGISPDDGEAKKLYELYRRRR